MPDLSDKLTQPGYWDAVHQAEGEEWKRSRPGAAPLPIAPAASSGWKARLKRALGPRRLAALRDYDQYLLWDVILPQYLSGRAGARAVEIGSAPGDFLVRLQQRFGVVPFGIEYSPVGVELNRRVFAESGIDPGNVIAADFFAPELHERYRESFDVVLSRGFIEHFSELTDVIDKHLNLLRPGGLLLVSIPNLRGFNYLLSWLFHREVLAMHNLAIMTKPSFRSLFPISSTQPLLCDYYGTFSFNLYNARPGSLMQLPLALCMKCQPILNALFRTLLRGRGAETPWFSPSLIFVGVKR
jgi:SAM-dependent methyltransferase